MLSNNLWEVVTDSWKQIAYVLWEQTNKKKTSVNLRMSMTAHGSDRVEKDVCKLVWVRRFLLRYSLLSLHCRTGIMRQPIQIFTWHQQTLFTGRRKSNVNHGNIATIYISLRFTVWQRFCYVLFFNFYLFWSVKQKFFSKHFRNVEETRKLIGQPNRSKLYLKCISNSYWNLNGKLFWSLGMIKEEQ